MQIINPNFLFNFFCNVTNIFPNTMVLVFLLPTTYFNIVNSKGYEIECGFIKADSKEKNKNIFIDQNIIMD